MGNTHKRYAREYRQRMVELVRAGRNAEELAREFQTPRNRFATGWRRQTVMRVDAATG